MDARIVPLESLVLRDQPRKHLDPAELAGLVDSIQRLGILESILVRLLPDGRYEILAGERRYRAARTLGMREVPVVVREVQEEGLLREIGLAENTARAGLSLAEVVLALREAYSSDEEFWAAARALRNVVLGGRKGELPEGLVAMAKATGLSLRTVAMYLHLLSDLPLSTLVHLARAGIGKAEAQRLKRDPALLRRFLEKVKEFQESGWVKATGIPSERLARDEVFRPSARRRRPRLEAALEHLREAIEAFWASEGLEDLAERLEEVLEEARARLRSSR